MPWPPQVRVAPRGCQSRVRPAPGPRLPWRLHEPLRPAGGGAGGAAGEEGAPGAPLVGPGARWEGLGRRWSPPPRPAQQRPGARRLLPGCMPASAWRSRPGSQRLVLPQPSGSGSAARARETTAESGCSGQPPPSAGPRPPPPPSASLGSFAR